MKILFLCTELAGYFVRCMQELKHETDADIMLVYWPPADNAPFKLNLDFAKHVDKSQVDEKTLLQSCIAFNPEIIYVAGWADKTYLRIAKVSGRNGAIRIGGADNPWKGSIKQRLSCVLAPGLVHPYFDFIWVPGSKQMKFARKLGYPAHRILTGLYAADVEKFANPHKDKFEKCLLYVGRFEPEKGIEMLVSTFSALSDEERNGWSLMMIGNGSLRNKIKPGHAITIHDFIQPEQLATLANNAGGFILPSMDEPWGVVVQEFAAAGLPLILSDAVNSGEQFLLPGVNGFLFQSNNPSSLKVALTSLFHSDMESLQAMSKSAYKCSQANSPQDWVRKLLAVSHPPV